MSMKAFLCVSVVLAVSLPSSTHGARELLTNPGFESGITGWRHDGFSMQTDSTHVYGGVASVKCTGRTKKYNGPAQDVNIKPGGRYLFNSYIRLINENPAEMYQHATVKIAFSYADGHKRYFPVATRSFLKSAEGWVGLGGDFICPSDGWTSARLYVEGLDPNIDYYYDEATLTELLTDDPNWETDANKRIQNLRKSNIHFKFTVDSKFDKNDLLVQIDHTRHLFGWGSMIRADNMVDPDMQTYQSIVYHMFNWATVEAYKWRYNRGNRTHPDYTVAVAATDALIKHNLKVRGHCMFWAVDGHSPDWVATLDQNGVKNAVNHHITYMTGITKESTIGMWTWHGHFFETHTGDPAFTEHMFTKVASGDPKPKLCLNEYNVVNTGESTQAYLSQILQFKAANVGLAMVGVQSHLHDYQEPDVVLLKKRLDIVAQAGLPIWITEFDLGHSNGKIKADWYEKVLRLYFSHPSIEGVTLWGFWDHDIDPLHALVHGYTFVLDEAGKRFLHLTKEEWSTHVNRSLASGTNFDVNGFQGDYDVIVWYRGRPIKKTTFHLGKNDRTVNVHVQGDGHAIQLPVQTDPFAVVPPNSDTSTSHLRTIGRATSTSQSAILECATRWSRVSQVGDDRRVDVACQTDEVLTGCSSILKNNDWQKDGEIMAMSNGKPVCRAVDGFRSTVGIQAIARCCKVKGLTCMYRAAGPSGTGVDDKVVASCNGNQMALGCSAWSFTTEADGTIFNKTSCAAQNDGYVTGVNSYAACCSGGNIKCDVIKSPPSGQGVGDTAHLTCPSSNDVMTGCNVFSKNGRSAGAYMSKTNGVDVCHAVNGFEKYGAEDGVVAMATCCHI